jgi:hypothetical protein
MGLFRSFQVIMSLSVVRPGEYARSGRRLKPFALVLCPLEAAALCSLACSQAAKSPAIALAGLGLLAASCPLLASTSWCSCSSSVRA